MSQVSRVSVNVQYATSPSATLGQTPQETTTEVEYLWGRITAALAIFIFAIALGIWFLFIQGKPSETIPFIEPENKHATKPENKAPISKAPQTKAPQNKILQVKAPQIKAPQVKAPQVKAPQVKVSQSIRQPVEIPAPTIDTKNTLSRLPTPPTSEYALNTEKTKPVAELKPTVSVKRTLEKKQPKESQAAKVIIHSPKISSAQLSLKFVKRTPTNTLPSTVTVPDGEILKIHFVTEYENLKNQWVYHEWYKEGVRMARIKLRPHKNKMLAHSSKNIDQHMTGHWQVKVVNDSKTLLAMGEFDVKPKNTF